LPEKGVDVIEKKGSRSRVNQILGYATSGTTIVLTALFIQKSDGNSAVETVALLGMAAVGAFLVAATFASHVYLAAPQSHRFSWYLSKRSLSVIGGVGGVALLVLSMALIDREDADYNQPPVGHVTVDSGSKHVNGEIVGDGDSVSLRNLIVSSNNEATRLVVSVVNTSKAPVVLDSASFVNVGDSDVGCADVQQRYSVDGEVHVDEKGRARAELRADEGPLAGFVVSAFGVYADECGPQTGIRLDFPISMGLNPQEASSLTIDIRKTAWLVEESSAGLTGGRHAQFPYVSSPEWATAVSVSYGADGQRDTAWVCLPADGSHGGQPGTSRRAECTLRPR
jgi:hypothetical protein